MNRDGDVPVPSSHNRVERGEVVVAPTRRGVRRVRRQILGEARRGPRVMARR